MTFRHLIEDLDRPTAHQPEVAGVVGDIHIGQALQQAIEQLGGRRLKG
jgi:hypothetical protein